MEINSAACNKRGIDQRTEGTEQGNKDYFEAAISNRISESVRAVNCIDGEEVSSCCNGFSTPRARRFRLPEKLPCPPAPKKRKLNDSAHCSSHKPEPVSFFTHPDMELFFLLALNDIMHTE